MWIILKLKYFSYKEKSVAFKQNNLIQFFYFSTDLKTIQKVNNLYRNVNF